MRDGEFADGARVLRAKIDQAVAQISLLDEQLARCRITSPFDGVIMSGDLSQSLGAPVERGDVLFDVAPMDAIRVIAEVDERDINDIVVGQKSDLVLPSSGSGANPGLQDALRSGSYHLRILDRIDDIIANVDNPSSPYFRTDYVDINPITGTPDRCAASRTRKAEASASSTSA